jgi:hypothetical protein
MCLSEPETAVHVLANCPATRRVWGKVIATAGLLERNLTPTGSTQQLQDWLCSTTGSLGNRGRCWGALVQLVWWNVWKERNSRIFQNHASSIAEIHTRIIEEATCWSNAAKPAALELLHRPREPD